MGATLTAPKLGMKGFFKLEAFKPVLTADGRCLRDANGDIIKKPGTERVLADWFPNTLLTNGRNQMSTRGDWYTCCQVGTNNTAPNAAQTSLLGFIYGVSSGQIVENNFGAQASAPYYGWRQKKWRFPVGTTAANLSEVGVGWSASSGSNLITRALIVDELGVPTTVTPLSDEILDVTYEFRYYPPLIDVTGQVTLDGTSYDYTIRAAEVTNSSAWGQNIGTEIGQYSVSVSDWLAYDDVLGTIIQSPNGTTANCDNSNQFDTTYSNNSYQQKVNTTCGPSGWNLGAGIRSIRIKTTAGWYQTQFDATSGGATIPKDANYTMDMSWIVSWDEATIP